MTFWALSQPPEARWGFTILAQWILPTSFSGAVTAPALWLLPLLDKTWLMPITDLVFSLYELWKSVLIIVDLLGLFHHRIQFWHKKWQKITRPTWALNEHKSLFTLSSYLEPLNHQNYFHITSMRFMECLGQSWMPFRSKTSKNSLWQLLGRCLGPVVSIIGTYMRNLWH